MEQLLQPVELRRIVEDDSRNRSAICPVVADDLGTEALDQLAADLRIFTKKLMDDLIARLRRRTVSCERRERLALAGPDPAGDGD
jgi:hypothetical protein